MKTKVSYLVALYNKEAFIQDAIDSIFNEADENIEIEICIVDDGSTDNSYNIVLENYSSNENLVLYKFKDNKGKNAAYNKAYELCTGSYISILGADDVVTSNRTAHLLNCSVRTGNAAYGGYSVYENESKTIIRDVYPEAVTIHQILLQNYLSGGCFLAPKELLENVFPIPEDLAFEDWWISFHLLRLDKVSLVRSIVTLYRIHNGNDMGVGTDFSTLEKDNIRRYLYLDKFKPFLSSKSEIQFWERAKALLDSFFGNKRFYNLLSPPFDKSWLKVLLFSVLGAKRFYKIRERLHS